MSTIKFKFFWIFRNFIPKPQFNSQDRTPRVRFRPLPGFYVFPAGWKCQPEGEDIGSGCCGGGVIQLRLRERALLRQGQLSEPQASSGPAAMLLAISQNLSCIPRRSPCPGRYPLPLAYGVLSTFRHQQYPPDGVPARPDILSLWRPLFSPTFLPTKKAGSSAHSLQTLTQTKILTPKPKEAPSTSYSQTSPQP